MKKITLISAFVALTALSANAQGLVAGWDFSDIPSVTGNVNGYAAEKTAVNNGYNTSGSIVTSLAQGSVISFASNGSAATGVQFNDGFDTTTSDLFGGGATGQQSLNVLSSPSASYNAFEVHFTASNNVVLNFDWLTGSTAAPTDFLNISYSTDGTSFSAFSPYGAFANNTAWGKTSDTGFYAFIGQANAVVDLTSVSSGESTIQAIRFEVANVSASERIGFDNIHVAGTAAVPEPSAFAAIAGALALGFVAVRRRR